MSWERDPLWAKAKLYFERAFLERRDDPIFGLWCSFALELLGRAALSSVSPTLLAEPDRDHKFLLHALNRGAKSTQRRSIDTGQVFRLCRVLFDEFSEEDLKAVLAMVNRRNDELHTGASAFDEYQTKQWLTGFYRVCDALTNAMGESLESLFGKDEAEVAKKILEDTREEVKQRVLSSIAAYRKVFEAKPETDRLTAAENARKEGEKLAHQRHHCVTCPSCGCVATVQGEPFGPEHVVHTDDGIQIRRPISPRTFACPACGLTLQSYAELDAAQLGGTYTRLIEQSPEDYYGLVNRDDIDPADYIDDALKLLHEPEYDNE